MDHTIAEILLSEEDNFSSDEDDFLSDEDNFSSDEESDISDVKYFRRITLAVQPAPTRAAAAAASSAPSSYNWVSINLIFQDSQRTQMIGLYLATAVVTERHGRYASKVSQRQIRGYIIVSTVSV